MCIATPRPASICVPPPPVGGLTARVVSTVRLPQVSVEPKAMPSSVITMPSTFAISPAMHSSPSMRSYSPASLGIREAGFPSVSSMASSMTSSVGAPFHGAQMQPLLQQSLSSSTLPIEFKFYGPHETSRLPQVPSAPRMSRTVGLNLEGDAPVSPLSAPPSLQVSYEPACTSVEHDPPICTQMWSPEPPQRHYPRAGKCETNENGPLASPRGAVHSSELQGQDSGHKPETRCEDPHESKLSLSPTVEHQIQELLAGQRSLQKEIQKIRCQVTSDSNELEVLRQSHPREALGPLAPLAEAGRQEYYPPVSLEHHWQQQLPYAEGDAAASSHVPAPLRNLGYHDTLDAIHTVSSQVSNHARSWQNQLETGGGQLRTRRSTRGCC